METAKQNIENFINSTNFNPTLGKNWYNMANQDNRQLINELNLNTKITIYDICLICSILSPANKWETNLLDTKNLLTWFFKDRHQLDQPKKPSFFTYGQNVNKAKEYLIARSNFRLINPHLDSYQVWRNFGSEWVKNNMKAQKTLNFFYNLSNPDYLNNEGIYFTIDRHMLKIAGIDKQSLTIKQYNELKKIFFEVFKESKIDCLFHEFQAILWTNYVYIKRGILHY